jgi:hypothetical protein
MGCFWDGVTRWKLSKCIYTMYINIFFLYYYICIFYALFLFPQNRNRWQAKALQQDHLRILFCQDVGDSNKTILYDSDYFSSNDIGNSRSPPNSNNMARSWNGSQFQGSGRNSLELGSFKDQRHDWRPSYMRTMPSLSISDQQKNSRPVTYDIESNSDLIINLY